jgi:polyferredoxin
MKTKVTLFTRNKLRLFVLFLALFVINGHFYVGHYEKVMEVLKNVPIPVLNCYSSPTTVWACPVGLIQHFLVLGSFTFATLGILLIIGALIGRWACGWLCPFGFLQELLSLPRWTRYLRYGILLVVVIIFPMFLTNDIGLTETWFCNFCPAGCLEAGIPVPIMDASLRYLIGTMYWIKIALLIGVVIIPSMFIKRPFCQTICPLGTIMGLCNSFSLLKLKFNHTKCVQCGLCAKDCPMGLDPTKEYGSPDCILCMNCTKEFCHAITPHFTNSYIKEEND